MVRKKHLKRFLFLIIIILFFISASPEEDKEFLNAENIFKFQDYKNASQVLESLLYPKIKIKIPENVMKAREYLGASYYFLGNKKRMEEEFTALLIKNPFFTLDPFYYPAPLIEEFNNLKKKLLSLHIISLKEEDKPKIEKVDVPIVHKTIKEKIVKKSYILNFFPFGIGQFQNNQENKGILFLLGEVVTLGINMGSYLAIEGLRGEDGFYSSSDARRAKKLRIVQYVSLGTFFTIAAWGIIDSLINYKEEVVEKEIFEEALREKPISYH